VSTAVESLEESRSDGDFATELAGRLESSGAVSGHELSELIGLGLASDERSRIVLNCLHNALLKRTVEHAVEHVASFRDNIAYRQWRHVAPGSLPDIGQWPVLNRSYFDTDHRSLLADDVQLRSICHTSGTTGNPVQVHKSFEEIDFLQSYFRTMIRASTRGLDRKPITFSLPNVYHGSPVPMPGPGLALVGGVTDDTLINDAVAILGDTYDIAGYDSRISVFSGLAHHVLFLTNYILEQGRNPKDFGLLSVNITGGYLGTRWRRFLVEAWGPIVNDRFSLTETIAGASRIRGTETFVFDPHIFAEILDPDDDTRPADVGRLVLSNLYPFIIMQPLLRYETGDLVARVENTRSGTLCFDYLGRRKNCISLMVDGQREWLVFSARLHDILSEIVDIRIFEWFSNVTLARDRTVGSLPIMRLLSHQEDTVLKLELKIELRYSPHTHLRRAEAMRQEIIAALRAVPRTTLARRIDDGLVDLEVTFLPSGGLGVPPEIKI
jgi:phenylacetate-coenzyme A ligase PaaK-like adenylate-forming protein